MLQRTAYVVLALAMFPLAACYHATIETGAEPAPQQVEEQAWAHGFLFGLVPPSTMEVEEECESGVATVETQLSFVNQLANFLTVGIYTPMHITVTCAEEDMSGDLGFREIDGGEFEETARKGKEDR